MANNRIVPDSAQYTIEEYLTEREMSSLPVLLVEGNDDSIFFQLIKDELLKKTYDDDFTQREILFSIEIDTCEIIKSPQDEILGNRGKVERICKAADNIGFESSLVGFVDREFREFELSQDINDCLKIQNKIGSVIWSRGHSIENYLFDVVILRDILRDYGINTQYRIQDALDLFKANFNEIIIISCAISLAAKDLELISMIETSIDASSFVFHNCKFQVDVEKWARFLSQKRKLDSSRINDFSSKLQYYLNTINACDSETLRWICHGHIGLSCIFSAFEACMIQTCKTKNITYKQKSQKINNRDTFTRFSSFYIQNQLNEIDNFQNTPIQCFQMLGFNPLNLSKDLAA